MTIRKQYPPRTYDTFPEDSPSESDRIAGNSQPSYHQTDSDKSRSAAAEARRLASQGSWADTFAGGTPATDQTPAASTVDGDEVLNVQYPPLAQEPDLSDPPPLYTPSDTTAPSPTVARSVAASEPVSTPVAALYSRTHLQCSHRDDEDDEEEADDDGALLPEPVQHQSQLQHHHHRATGAESDSVPTFMRRPDQCSSRSGCGGPRHRRGCGGRRHGRGGRSKERARRFKRACFFIFALLLCLWLMIPGLLKALSNDKSSPFPFSGLKPSTSPNSWPPEKREQRQHETSQSISGTHQLYDLLDLSTTSGSISVNVEVQPGDKPAVLRLATTSGSIHVRMTSERGWFRKPTIPDSAKDRTLQTDISTRSGSLSGALIHGNGGSTRISAQSASISFDIFTVGVSEHDPASNISTTTNSGSQNVRVVAPLGSTEPVRAIGASHTVLGSGSMSIRYPMEWEGTVHVHAQGSGSVSAGGHGLVVRQQSSRELYGYKGNKEGLQIEVFEQGSGSIRFQC